MCPRKRRIRAVALRASRKARRRRARPVAPRKRVAEGLRAPTLRGGGARGVGSSSALFPNGSSAWQRRNLQSTVPRSHDERCPSGSGWDKALSRAPERVAASRGARQRKPPGSWPVKPRRVLSTRRMGSRPRPTKVLGRPQGLLGAGEAAPPVSGVGTVIIERSFGFSRRIRSTGSAKAMPGERSERRAQAHAGGARRAGDGDQAVLWSCSRVVLVAEVDERRLVQAERPWV
jgi:hypothetical protein